MSFSIIIPAHNEEAYIGPCLDAALDAASHVDEAVEIVVVANRCTDRTEAVAREAGAIVIIDESRCIAKIRNAGVAASSGRRIVTCDADSRLHPNMLERVAEELDAGAVGGGVDLRFDRRSIGIRVTEFIFRAMVRLTGHSCASFWTTRASFDAVGGFDEKMPMGEDFDFAKRLDAWGRVRSLRYRTLWDTPLLSSARKFDHYGDWSFLKMIVFDAARIHRSIKGVDTEFVDEYFYEFNDRVKATAPEDSNT